MTREYKPLIESHYTHTERTHLKHVNQRCCKNKKSTNCYVLLINKQIESNNNIKTSLKTLVGTLTAKIASSLQDFGGNTYSKNNRIIYIINYKF